MQVFLSYIQADAYEPLTVEAISYNIYDKDAVAEIAKDVCSDPKSQEGMYIFAKHSTVL